MWGNGSSSVGGSVQNKFKWNKQGEGGASNHHTSDHSEPLPAMCSHLSDSEIKNIGPKQRAATVCLPLPITVEPVHPHVNLNVLEINSLRKITSPTVCYLHPGKDAEAKKCFHLFLNIFFRSTYCTTHTPHLIGFDWAQSRPAREHCLPELWNN